VYDEAITDRREIRMQNKQCNKSIFLFFFHIFMLNTFPVIGGLCGIVYGVGSSREREGGGMWEGNSPRSNLNVSSRD